MKLSDIIKSKVFKIVVWAIAKSVVALQILLGIVAQNIDGGIVLFLGILNCLGLLGIFLSVTL